MSIHGATENPGLPRLSSYWFILLQPLFAYIKQRELPLAPSSILAGLCQALLLIVPFSLLLNTSSSQKCYLLSPSASLACQAAKPACLLQPLWPTSCSHNCLLSSPSVSHGIHRATRSASCCLLQPLWTMSSSQTRLSPSASSDLYHAQVNMKTTQSSLLWIQVSLQIPTQWQIACWHCIQTDSVVNSASHQ